MVHATWGESFLKNEIEATDPDGLSIWYLGCNGFVIRTLETTLYLDPFFGDGDPPSFYRMIPVPLDPSHVEHCDGVLVTHEHLDHFHPNSYGPILDTTGADLCAPSSCFDNPQKDWDDFQAPPEQRRIVEPGDTLEFNDLTVHVRPGDDPDSVGEVTYVVEHESGIFFNAGDSRYTDAFEEIGEEFDIDLGSLVFGTHARIFWHEGWVGDDERPETRSTKMYMTENDVIKSANALGIDRLVPCHFDMWKGSCGDPKVLHQHVASYPFPHVLEVAEIGDRLDVSEPGVKPLRMLDEH
jgi:L-ascorbate 6-phosphate lactonase